MQLEQWLAQHKELKDQALADAVKKLDGGPSVQGLARLPYVVQRLRDDIRRTPIRDFASSWKLEPINNGSQGVGACVELGVPTVLAHCESLRFHPPPRAR